MGSCYAKKAVDFAIAQVGKECGKTNEYSEQLDAVDYFNTQKNGYADSCSIFVNACVYNACEEPTPEEDPEGAKWTALYMMYEPASGNAAAGCTQAAGYFKQNDAYYTDPKDFERGDQLFFKRSDGALYHTGIIVDWNEDGLDVVEGNTNGGMVALKNYSYDDPKIAGVGRPRYDGWEEPKSNAPVKEDKPEPAPVPVPEPKGEKYIVTNVSSWLNVRNGCGKEYPVVDKLYNGEEVTVYEIKDGWARISNDMDLWVSMDYLTKV